MAAAASQKKSPVNLKIETPTTMKQKAGQSRNNLVFKKSSSASQSKKIKCATTTRSVNAGSVIS